MWGTASAVTVALIEMGKLRSELVLNLAMNTQTEGWNPKSIL